MRTLLTLGLAFPLAAQSPDFDAIDAELRFKLDDAGQIWLYPDPAAGGASEEFTPLVEFDSVMMNGGVFAWLAIVYQGSTDLASMADAASILGRLGRASDAALIESIEAPATSAHDDLLRLLAVRLVADLGKRQALEPLLLLTKDPYANQHLRRAARESYSILKGEQPSPDQLPMPPVAAVIASAPAAADVVWRIDHGRMPSGRILLPLGRDLGMAVTKREILRAGGTVSPAQWAGAVKIAEGTAAFPYEVARQFGNHRIERTISAVTLPTDPTGEPAIWARLDGRFDVTRLKAGLIEMGVDCSDDKGSLIIGPIADDDGEPVEVTVTSTHAIMRIGAVADPLGEQGAAEIASALSGHAQVAAYLRPGVELPDLPPPLRGFGVPGGVTIALPSGDDTEVRVEIERAERQLITLLKVQLEAAPRMLDQWLDSIEDPEPFEPLVAALEGMTITATPTSLEVTLEVAGIDFPALLRAAAAAGRF